MVPDGLQIQKTQKLLFKVPERDLVQEPGLIWDPIVKDPDGLQFQDLS